jgi:chemotaxis protein MotB
MPNSSQLLTIAALSLSLSATGCVSAGKYDAALAEIDRARAGQRTAQAASLKEVAALKAEVQELKDYMREAEARCTAIAVELARQKMSAIGCVKALDETTAMNSALRAELERLGKDANELLQAKGSLASSLEQARQRLDELRRAQTAAEARAALFQEVALKLKRMIDAGELTVVLRSGRMVLVLPTDVLFDSGKTKIMPRGKEALAEVGAVLATLSGRRFQVAGHTDDQPIRFSAFASNWELSAARGVEVTRFLIESGMRPDLLSAAGYGEFDPVASNDSVEGRTRNRRIEITLQPNIDEMVAVPRK